MIWNYDNASDSLRRMLTKLDDMSYCFEDDYPELAAALDEAHSHIRKAARMAEKKTDRVRDIENE